MFKKKFGLLFVLAASLSFTQQSTAPVQLTQVPPKPTCVPVLRNGACSQLWNVYNQAAAQRVREEIQLYGNRQKELATAPLQQQIVDLNKLVSDQQEQIKKLSDQIQADAGASLQTKNDDANTALREKRSAFEEGLGIGAGVLLALSGIIFGITRLTRNFTVSKKPQSRAASA
jgi:hypothetical protein